MSAAMLSTGGANAYGAPGVPEADVIGKYAELIPVDKGLNPAWIRSLTARGKPQSYSERNALDHIGMPVGGLFAGTVYLGGDGRLWLWNVMNDDREGIVPRTITYKGRNIKNRDGCNYVEPAPRTYPFEQNFGLRVDGKLRTLDADGFGKVSFTGQYPIGLVTYEDEASPLSVTLEAFSPFIPLNTADSSLPVTVMSYKIRNNGTSKVTADIFGWMKNPICLNHGRTHMGSRENAIRQQKDFTALVCSASESKKYKQKNDPQKDIVYETFEGETYGNWTLTGTAFGDGPILLSDIPSYQGNLGAEGKCVVNSHSSAPGVDTGAKDGAVGTLTSPAFKVERSYINVLVGGGSHKNTTCVRVLLDGKTITSVSGNNNNLMSWKTLNTTALKGKKVKLQVLDNHTGGWGNIGIDQVVFSDKPKETKIGSITELPDFGTMTLTVLNERGDDLLVSADTCDPLPAGNDVKAASASLTGNLPGAVGKRIELKPGCEETVDFLITWHFPNLTVNKMKDVGREYASRFDGALSVARYISKNRDRLFGTTRLWRDTWYDSSLPYWFLDKTMANTSILATTTAYRFRDGRFWAWEGIGSCYGTCTHVWHYAQAPGRLFPDVERRQREEVDFGIALHKDGGIGMRSTLTSANRPADDGQCGRILGAYREHQMSKDNAFLKRTWPNIKKAILFMIKRDTNRDGILEGAQHNTLDAAWYGRISFLASLYLAALRAGEAMATEMGDAAFAVECNAIATKGAQTIMELYNGEYFFHELDPKHIDNVAVGTGCYIDQVFGQSWAHQVGLGHLFDAKKTRSSLAALYKYNFVPNIGRFRDTFKRGRWYATDDDKGLIMCSWPKGGLNEKWLKAWQFMYFNECMTGFEWQASAHMIAEGLVEEGMSVGRAIHDRYDAHLRNPYNEIECSDHYSRSMASYGAYLAACGYESHGPKGHLGFAPKVRAGKTFKCAFTAAGGWGSFVQEDGDRVHVAVKWGEVKIKTLGLDVSSNGPVTATLSGQAIRCHIERCKEKAVVVFEELVPVEAGEVLTVQW